MFEHLQAPPSGAHHRMYGNVLQQPEPKRRGGGANAPHIAEAELPEKPKLGQ